jgi:hypothetical protein
MASPTAFRADRRLEICHAVVLVRVNAAVQRHPEVAFDPHLSLDGGFVYPPWPQQALRFEHDLPALICSTCHDDNRLMQTPAHAAVRALRFRGCSLVTF